MLYSVITTILNPTESVKILSAKHKLLHLGDIAIVADAKGPNAYDLDKCILLTLADQHELFPALASLLPTNHYSRKNIGYLYAIKKEASCIYETDDDNSPNKYWYPRSIRHPSKVRLVKGSSGWVNIYSYFSDQFIWPRGLPLDLIRDSTLPTELIQYPIDSPIQQGLVNLSPDVDAIWRLLFDNTFRFNVSIRHSVLVPQNVWSPFNTQTTWWWPVVYPLLYIPSFCSFRMCDIWRSLIAQRCIWELGYGILYHPPEVTQDRNPHDLMADFIDEVPGYISNAKIAQILESLSLKPGIDFLLTNFYSCYEALVKHLIFPKEELALVQAWTESIS